MPYYKIQYKDNDFFINDFPSLIDAVERYIKPKNRDAAILSISPGDLNYFGDDLQVVRLPDPDVYVQFILKSLDALTDGIEELEEDLKDIKREMR